MIWDGFSNESLLARAQAVYSGALAIYEAFVGGLFQTLVPDLTLAQLLPARLVGRLHPDSASRRGPGLTYYIEPVASTMKTTVEIAMDESEPRFDWDKVTEVSDRVRAIRPDVATWLQGSVSSGHLDLFGANPATRLAEEWLTKDLERVHWSGRAGTAF